ncbi:MAG: sensor domain-containing diguanylate cyclase [Thermodesulforhabdaceae bacterium]
MLRKNFYNLCKCNNELKSKGTFQYTFEGSKKIATIHDIDKVGWKVITEIEKSEVIWLIINKVVLSMPIVILISTAIGWILSRNLSRNIVSPIVELRKRTQAILDKKTPSQDFVYPDNEIGQIAKDLEKLTQDALYLKNLQLQELADELKTLSETDQLTGLYNRRKMESHLHDEFIRYERYGRPFSIILLDVDHFKLINDNYGHDTGDSVLKEISSLLRKHTRKSDVVARWGGEEFLILCPETNGRDASILAEKLRKIIKEHNFGIDRSVTISAGIAEMNANFSKIQNLLTHADRNLYKAKSQGRDRCIFE